MSRKMIRLPINTIRTLLSQHHFSSGYQPCAARLTSPRGLFLACESKTQARTRKKKASAKQKRAAQKNQKCGCPILPSLRTYLILPRLKLIRSDLSVLSDFTKPANLSDFTRAEN
jgi:hypothetical protein